MSIIGEKTSKSQNQSLKQSDSDDSMEVDESNCEDSNSSSTIMAPVASLSLSINSTKKSSSSLSKKRGRPRLYAVNPLTGKSMKGRLLLNGTKDQKPAHVTTNGIAIYPSPSSSSASYSPSMPTIIIANNAAPPVNLMQTNVVQANVVQSNQVETETEKTNEEAESVGRSEEADVESNEEEIKELEEEKPQEMHKSPKIEYKPVVAIEKKTPQKSTQDVEDEIESMTNCMSPPIPLPICSIRLSPTSIKSQVVLTHIIEGYVIKESSKPFPVRPPTVSSSCIDNDPAQAITTSIPKLKKSKKASKKNEDREPLNEPKLTSTPSKNDSLCADSKSVNLTDPAEIENKPCLKECATTEAKSDDQLDVSNGDNKPSKSEHKHKHHHRHHSCSRQSDPSDKSAKKKAKKSRDSLEKSLETTNDQENLSNHQNNNNNKSSTNLEETMEVCATPAFTFIQPQMHFSPQSHHHTSLPSHSSPQFTIPLTLPNSSTASSSPNTTRPIQTANLDAQLPAGDPTEWNCDEVFDFVRCVAGVAVAELFKSQEVDGSALNLIRDDHLVNTMQIKLGPALKIMNKFNELKHKFNAK